MRVTGTDIVQFDVFRFNAVPETTAALNWIQAADGNWLAVDRGATNDVYKSKVTFYGTETEVDNIIDQFEANRAGGTNYFTLSQFNIIEDQIFGADIYYTSGMDATIVKWDKRKQKQFKSYTWSCTMQLIEDPYPYSGTPSLPTLKPLIGYQGDSTWTIKKLDTYDNTFTYIDHEKDTGIFEGTFILGQTDMKNFRRYLLSTIRGGDMIIADIAGVTNPFGSKRGGYPITVKVLDFKDELININFWRIKMKLAEVV